jgi:hypothetical protein
MTLLEVDMETILEVSPVMNGTNGFSQRALRPPSESPQEAINTMIQLNNKYALDGRNPNSYSGVFWVLGRYDRAWGPERPIFGKVRYMSSENTARKTKVKQYIQRFSAVKNTKQPHHD